MYWVLIYMWSIDVLVIGIWFVVDEKYLEINFFFVMEKWNYINNMSYKIKLFCMLLYCWNVIKRV